MSHFYPKSNNVYLSLGSNIGNRVAFLNHAIQTLKTTPQIKVLTCSSFYSTKAVDVSTPQPDYLNAVCFIQTSLAPQKLLSITQSIECRYGRTEKGSKKPRSLDIDILFYNDTILKKTNLIIPHPHAHKRLFVIKPMLELNPNYQHPLINKTIQELSLGLL